MLALFIYSTAASECAFGWGPLLCVREQRRLFCVKGKRNGTSGVPFFPGRMMSRRKTSNDLNTNDEAAVAAFPSFILEWYSKNTAARRPRGHFICCSSNYKQHARQLCDQLFVYADLLYFLCGNGLLATFGSRCLGSLGYSAIKTRA